MKFVPGNGPIPNDIMIIGEAPGANEAEEGIPFIGKAGQILNEALSQAEIPRESVYITNIYKYRPPDNRTPTDTEIFNHLPYLIEEFKEVKPRYVLLLGNTALYAITGESGISAAHGTRLAGHKRVPLFNFPFMYCTYHPMATVYNKTTRQDFFNDVTTFAKIAKGTYT